MARIFILTVLVMGVLSALITFGADVVAALTPYTEQPIVLGSVAAVATALIAYAGHLINAISNDHLAKEERENALRDAQSANANELAVIASTVAGQLGAAVDLSASSAFISDSAFEARFVVGNTKEVGRLGPRAVYYATTGIEHCRSANDMKTSGRFAAPHFLSYRNGDSFPEEEWYQKIEDLLARATLIKHYFWCLANTSPMDPNCDPKNLPIDGFMNDIAKNRIRFSFAAIDDLAKHFAFPNGFAEEHRYKVYPEHVDRDRA